MPVASSQPTTFVDMVLALLEDRFPWLGTQRQVSGADTVDQLTELHRTLRQKRTAARNLQPRLKP
jgi:hypothetical protein